MIEKIELNEKKKEIPISRLDEITLSRNLAEQLLKAALTENSELSDQADAIVRAALRYVSDIRTLLEAE